MTDPIFTARVPFTAPQIGAQYDPQQMRTVVNGIKRSIPPTVTRTVTADTTIAGTDQLVVCDTTTTAQITVTLLPPNQVQFLPLQIKNYGPGAVTISGTVDGSGGLVLGRFASLWIQSDGVVWHLLGHGTPTSGVVVNVTDPPWGFLLGTGLTDAEHAANISALERAWEVVRYSGGEFVTPPGDYEIATQFVAVADQHVNIHWIGTGATFYSPGVTTTAIKILGGRTSPYGVVVSGLSGWHRQNPTVLGLLEFTDTACSRAEDCAWTVAANATGYAGIRLTSSVLGDTDFGCFWTKIERCHARILNGADGPAPDYGILIVGPQNATEIIDCTLSNCKEAVAFVTDGVGAGLANGCIVFNNALETCTKAVTTTAFGEFQHAGALGFHTAGLRIWGNRIERCTVFFGTYTEDGLVALDSFSPPDLRGNMCSIGSVTTWVDNPTGAKVSTAETGAYGTSVPYVQYCTGPVSFPTRTIGGGAQSNFLIRDSEGLSAYNRQHLEIGAVHLWPNAGTSLKIAPGTPALSTDGKFLLTGPVEGELTGYNLVSPVLTGGVLTVAASLTTGGSGATRYIGAVGTSAVSLAYNVPTTGDHRFFINTGLVMAVNVNGIAVTGVVSTTTLAATGRIVSGQATPTEAMLVSGITASSANSCVVTLTAARVVGVLIAPSIGQRFAFTFIQDGTGGWAITFNALYKVSWSDTGNTAGKRSTIEVIYDGTNYNQVGAQTPYV